MNIVILSPAWPFRGGIAKFTHRLARQYQAQGDKVHIENFTLLYPPILFPGKSQYDDTPEPTDLSIHRSINSINPFSWIATGMRLRRKNYDLCIAIYFIPALAPAIGTVARIIKGNRHTHVVGMLHNLYPHETRPFDKPLIKYMIGSCQSFVTLSSAVNSQLEQLTSKPHAIAPHPLYDSFGEQVSPKEAINHLANAHPEWQLSSSIRYLLFFGFIRPYKGLDLLLQSIATLKPQLKQDNVKFLVAGEFYGDPSQYLDLAKQLDINEHIIWANQFIADHDVRYFFSLADALILPYRSATQSGVTQIAYHFSVPMVLTRVGALPEVVPDGECGIVCEPNPQSIASAITQYLHSNRQDYVDAIQQRKQLYSWQKFATTLASV